jgi:CubicO group peptidase (beta-lactamase class C family)
MNPSLSTLRLALGCAILSLAAAAAHSQAPLLPPPDTTDPVALGIMQGFPPAPDKTVRLGSVLKYPNARWALHHMRELGPTAAVWRGGAGASALPAAPRALDAIEFDDGEGKRVSIADWQRTTYTDGLIVLHKGKVVSEQLYAGMLAREPHALWSMSKSFTGLLATALVAEGRIDPNALVSAYLPELRESAWGDATVQQTLDMTTGVQYTEDFRDPSSGIFQYLFAGGLLPAPATYAGPRTIPDFLKTVRKQGEHGAGFVYKTVDTEVIGWLLERVTGKSFATLMSERIWSRIGAQEDAYVWADPTGTQLASVGMNATLRDLARVGEMLRLDGRYNGQQVLPAGVVAEIRKGADPEKFKAANMPMRAGYSYHNHFWIPHDAAGTFEMKGLFGQHMHVNPAAELVIVKLTSHPVGDTRFTHTLDRKAFAAIAAAVSAR